ncbi:Proteasome inhibitor PI31 subunit [Cichlidogyrus casuarinus]|uniref:Proteasome inhibitor PI31 subunit n=1 Tax=Cichlidogyrus casuarinus TaxID=1844966 RepID=A0ABD2QCA4_9PLAT
MSMISAVELSLLEYLCAKHLPSMNKRSSIISLLLHTEFLARGARLARNEDNKLVLSESSVIPDDVLGSDVIRLSYILHRLQPTISTSSSVNDEQTLTVSITEADDNIFVNLTDGATDKFSHVELSGLEHVNIPTPGIDTSVHTVYPKLDELVRILDKDLLGQVLRPPRGPPSRVTACDVRPAAPAPTLPQSILPADYGRADLDPFAQLRPPTGGMIFEPRRPFYPGPGLGGPDVLPPGSVPPGARFDPFGPGLLPPRRPGRDHFRPDFDDMFS